MGKKITFCTYDAPYFHGPNTWLKRLLPELSRHGFSIEVLVFFEGDLNECATNRFFVGMGFNVKNFEFKSTAEKKIRWILETLSADPPDIFVPNMIVHALFAAAWIKKAGIETIGLLHSDDKFYDGMIKEFVSGTEKFKLTAVVSCSKYLFNKVSSKHTSDVILKCIPYGVPIDNIPQTNFQESNLKLIYIGRLVEEQKRISKVIKAMCRAANEIDGVEAVIYGHGDVSKTTTLIKKHSANNKVKYCGSVSNAEVFNTLASAHVFVLLSDYEGLPQTLLEAMACGLVPVCSFMKSGIPELIINNETGIIVKNRSSDFVDAIKKLKENPALLHELSENAKDKVSDYSSNACTVSWINLLNELLLKNIPRRRIEIPAKISLPKPHRYLKREDIRNLSPCSNLLAVARKTKAFFLLKRLMSS
jgi:colanic acid/amylovoran biosynthesis glycosyltransferase